MASKSSWVDLGLWARFLLLLLVLLAASDCVFSELCVTLPTQDGTSRPERCQFPFRYKGKTFDSCTDEGDVSGKPWCSTQVDKENVHVSGSGHWGHCDLRACSFTSFKTSNQKQQCITVRNAWIVKQTVTRSVLWCHNRVILSKMYFTYSNTKTN